jgi:hypothetical protein
MFLLLPMTHWFAKWFLFTIQIIWVIKVAASTELQGRAIARAVSRRPSSSLVRFASQIKSCGICGEQSGAGALFLLAFLFTFLFLLPRTAPHSLIIRHRSYVGFLLRASLNSQWKIHEVPRLSAASLKSKIRCVAEEFTDHMVSSIYDFWHF